jgi:mannose-P-dolichol utilization defect protein 1
MFWVYSKFISTREKAVLFAFFNGYAYLLLSGDKYLTPEHWNWVQSSAIILLIASRIPQIMTNFQNKSTGQLAFFTFILNFLGGVARLGTVMVETSDFMYQLPFFIGVFLNGVIVAQFLLYWNNKVVQLVPTPLAK